MRWILLAALVAGCHGCASPQPQPPMPPLVLQVDAGYEASELPCPTYAESPCGAACCNERLHSCRIGFPTAKGASCETRCAQFEKMSEQLHWPTACMAKATTCQECQ